MLSNRHANLFLWNWLLKIVSFIPHSCFFECSHPIVFKITDLTLLLPLGFGSSIEIACVDCPSWTRLTMRSVEVHICSFFVAIFCISEFFGFLLCKLSQYKRLHISSWLVSENAAARSLWIEIVWHRKQLHMCCNFATFHFCESLFSVLNSWNLLIFYRLIFQQFLKLNALRTVSASFRDVREQMTTCAVGWRH